MTNRERLLRTDLHDLLVMVNDSLEEICVLDILKAPTLKNCNWKFCDKCIENWLNQEANE